LDFGWNVVLLLQDIQPTEQSGRGLEGPAKGKTAAQRQPETVTDVRLGLRSNPKVSSITEMLKLPNEQSRFNWDECPCDSLRMKKARHFRAWLFVAEVCWDFV